MEHDIGTFTKRCQRRYDIGTEKKTMNKIFRYLDRKNWIEPVQM